MVAQALARSELLLRQAPWDKLDDEFAKRIPMDSPSEHNDYLREMVKEGRATLHQLLVDGKRVGLTITTVEIHSAGRELVSIATYSNNTLGITPALSEALEEMARHENCQCIRLHTARHGLVKLATENYGFRISEIVLRKNING